VADTAGSALVLASFLYESIIRFAQFVVLRFRADVDKEVEILVLRHQLAVLRRQIGKGQDRASRSGRARIAVSVTVPRTLAGVLRNASNAPALAQGRGPVKVDLPESSWWATIGGR
jgi:hypothetical protein